MLTYKHEYFFKGDTEKPKNGLPNNLSQLDKFTPSPLVHVREQSFHDNGLCLKKSPENTVEAFRSLQGLENSENTFFSDKTVDKTFEAKSFRQTVGTSVENTSPFLKNSALLFSEKGSENRVKPFLFPQDTEKTKNYIFLKKAVDELNALKKTSSISVENTSHCVKDDAQSFLEESSENTVKPFIFFQGSVKSENPFVSNKTVEPTSQETAFEKTASTSVENTSSPFLKGSAPLFSEKSSKNRVKPFLFPQDTEKTKNSVFLKKAVDELNALKKSSSISVENTSHCVKDDAPSSLEKSSENTVKPFLFLQGSEKSENSFFCNKTVDQTSKEKAFEKTVSTSVKNTSTLFKDGERSSRKKGTENTVKPFLSFKGSAKNKNSSFSNERVDQTSKANAFALFKATSSSIENLPPFVLDCVQSFHEECSEDRKKIFRLCQRLKISENSPSSVETVDQTFGAKAYLKDFSINTRSTSFENTSPFIIDTEQLSREDSSEDRKKSFLFRQDFDKSENSTLCKNAVEPTSETKDFVETTRLSSSSFQNPSPFVHKSEQKSNEMDSEDTVKLFLSLQNCESKDNVPLPYKVTQHTSERSSVENAMKTTSTIERRSKPYSLCKAASRSRKSVLVDAVVLDIIKEQRMSWWSMDDNPPKCHSESLPNLSVKRQVNSSSSEQKVRVKSTRRNVDEANNKLMNILSYDKYQRSLTVQTPDYLKQKTKPLEKSSWSDYDSRIFAKAKEGKSFYWTNKFSDESELDDSESSLDGSFRHNDSYDSSCSDSSEDLLSCKPIEIPNMSRTFEDYLVPCESGLKETPSMSDVTFLESDLFEHPDIFFIGNGAIVFGLVVLLCLSIYCEDLKLFLNPFS